MLCNLYFFICFATSSIIFIFFTFLVLLCKNIFPTNRINHVYMVSTIKLKVLVLLLSTGSKPGYKKKTKTSEDVQVKCDCINLKVASGLSWAQWFLWDRHPNTWLKRDLFLIRLLVLKLPIDFYCGGLWGSDPLRFLASTKAKLSHLEAGPVYWDSSSALTPPAN